MLSNTEYIVNDAVGLADLRASGDISAQELLQCALSQSARLNPSLNAVVTEDAKGALKIATALDGGKHQGLLSGVPFLVK
jgi:Asp-tRNA(Asn)/Glu-tRNA(Gln) amidotransferase A subunit family amidase